jgi:hypothetical protein
MQPTTPLSSPLKQQLPGCQETYFMIEYSSHLLYMVNMILTTAEIVVPNENNINLHNAEMATMGCIMSYEHGRMISNRILVIIIKVQTMKEMFD